jgi:hypothetical protein
MNSVRLRDPYEIPLYIFSVLVNLFIVAVILAGALLLGFLNALIGEPLSGPMVEVGRAAFIALLLLVPGLVVYRQLTRAGIRGSAVRLSRLQSPDIYAVKEDFARRLGLKREPEIYVMSGNGVLNAFAASTIGSSRRMWRTVTPRRLATHSMSTSSVCVLDPALLPFTIGSPS